MNEKNLLDNSSLFVYDNFELNFDKIDKKLQQKIELSKQSVVDSTAQPANKPNAQSGLNSFEKPPESYGYAVDQQNAVFNKPTQKPDLNNNSNPAASVQMSPTRSMSNLDAPQIRTKQQKQESTIQSKFGGIDSEMLSKMAQEFLEKINSKRSNDELTHAQFKTTFAEWANQFTTKCIESTYNKYEAYSKCINQKFQSISEELEKTERLEQELKTISNEVEQLYKAISNDEF
jgi:hypothetical protein